MNPLRCKKDHGKHARGFPCSGQGLGQRLRSMAKDQQTDKKTTDQTTKPLPHPESDANTTQDRGHKTDMVEEPPGPYKDGVPSQPIRRDGA